MLTLTIQERWNERHFHFLCRILSEREHSWFYTFPPVLKFIDKTRNANYIIASHFHSLRIPCWEVMSTRAASFHKTLLYGTDSQEDVNVTILTCSNMDLTVTFPMFWYKPCLLNFNPLSRVVQREFRCKKLRILEILVFLLSLVISILPAIYKI